MARNDLTPYHFTKENAKEMQKKSVEKRRKVAEERKILEEENRKRNSDILYTLQEAIKLPLYNPTDSRVIDISQIKCITEAAEMNMTAGQMIGIKLVADALNGDKESLKLMLRFLGYLDEDKKKDDTPIQINFIDSSEESQWME